MKVIEQWALKYTSYLYTQCTEMLSLHAVKKKKNLEEKLYFHDSNRLLRWLHVTFLNWQEKFPDGKKKIDRIQIWNQMEKIKLPTDS